MRDTRCIKASRAIFSPLPSSSLTSRPSHADPVAPPPRPRPRTPGRQRSIPGSAHDAPPRNPESAPAFRTVVIQSLSYIPPRPSLRVRQYEVVKAAVNSSEISQGGGNDRESGCSVLCVLCVYPPEARSAIVDLLEALRSPRALRSSSSRCIYGSASATNSPGIPLQPSGTTMYCLPRHS